MLEVDTIVLCAGQECLRELGAPLKAAGARVLLIGGAAIAGVSRDFRGQAHVRIRGKDEVLTVSRIYSHLFKQM